MGTFDSLAQPFESERATTVTTGLSVEDCLALLSGSTVGRLAVSVGALPAIFPVHYRTVDNAIWFRAASDGSLLRASNGSVVAFEVDGCDGSGPLEWSVLVQGIAEEVADPARLESVEAQWFAASPRRRGADRHLVLPITIISGSRYV